MSHFKYVAVIFFSLFGVMLFASAEDNDLKVTCTPNPVCAKSDTQICIDAETGRIDSEKTNLGVHKQVAVTVYNKNPLAYQYKLNLAPQAIQDDDISSFLKLVLPSSSKPDVQSAKTSAQTSTATTKTMMTADMVIPFEGESLKQSHAQTGELPTDEVQQLGDEISGLADTISKQFDTYAGFADQYRAATAKMNQSGCTLLQEQMNTLHRAATTVQNTLLAQHAQILTDISKVSDDYAHVSKDVDTVTSGASYKLDDLIASQPQKGKEAEHQQKSKDAFKLFRDGQAMKASLDKTKQSALNLECMYLDFSQKQLGSLYYGVISALERASVASGNYWRSGIVGPYDDPTSVTVSLQRKPLSPPQPLSAVKFQLSSAQACSKDLLTANDFAGATYSVSSDSQESSKSGDGKTSDSAKGSTSNTKPATPSSDSGFEDRAKIVLHFGGARFITGAGIVFGVMKNPQYERVSGIPLDSSGNPTSTTFTSIVGATSDSSIRVVPSLFLHTRLFPTWDGEAAYFTFAIGPHFDNTGASPEGLVGLSHSLVDQRLFLTAGAYIGQQEQLKNGLYVGRDVSSLQGSLPIEKTTMVRFGFGFSYRFNIGSSSSTKQTKPTTTPGGGTQSPNQ